MFQQNEVYIMNTGLEVSVILTPNLQFQAALDIFTQKLAQLFNFKN